MSPRLCHAPILLPLVAALACVAACASEAPLVAVEPASPASETAPGLSTSAEPTTKAESVTSAAAETQAPAADTRVSAACAKLCARKASECGNHQPDICTAECAGHEAKAAGCEAQIEAALLCQTGAKQTPCNNVAAGACTEAFLTMQRCKRGELPAQATKSKSLPEGWIASNDADWGVALALPTQHDSKTSDGRRALTASFEGAVYEIRELARPKELTENALIKLVIAHVGVTCQKQMRLTGRVERDELLMTRFETSCGKGERIYGRLRIDKLRALSMTVRGTENATLREQFFEGLR